MISALHQQSGGSTTGSRKRKSSTTAVSSSENSAAPSPVEHPSSGVAPPGQLSAPPLGGSPYMQPTSSLVHLHSQPSNSAAVSSPLLGGYAADRTHHHNASSSNGSMLGLFQVGGNTSSSSNLSGLTHGSGGPRTAHRILHPKEQSSDEKGLSSSDEEGDHAILDVSPVRAKPNLFDDDDDDSFEFNRAGLESGESPMRDEGEMEEDEELVSPVSPQPGRLVVEYSNHQDIGSGDFGDVVVATYDEDGQTYAIKTTKKTAAGERELQSFLQEVYALSACNSPYILRYYDAWIDAGLLSIRTEFANGGTLRKVQSTPWAEDAIWELMLQTSLGVHHLHCNNIVHLDIKPDNIFVHYDVSVDPTTGATLYGPPQYKIGDFGLARTVEERSPIGEHFKGLNDDEGDRRYLCPVLLAQSDNPFLREADLYSLGATISELTGADIVRYRYEKIISFDNNAYSPRLTALLGRMLDVNPAVRPTAFEVVCAAASAIHALHPESPLRDISVAESTAAYQNELNQLEAEYQQLLVAQTA